VRNEKRKKKNKCFEKKKKANEPVPGCPEIVKKKGRFIVGRKGKSQTRKKKGIGYLPYHKKVVANIWFLRNPKGEKTCHKKKGKVAQLIAISASTKGRREAAADNHSLRQKEKESERRQKGETSLTVASEVKIN